MAGILEQLKTISDDNEILVLNEREFKALIGVSPAAFVKLLAPFAQSQAELKQKAEAVRSRPQRRLCAASIRVLSMNIRLNSCSSTTSGKLRVR